MARIQKKTVLLAVLAMACTRSAYGTVELIDAALQAKASELESLKGQGSGSTSTTTEIGYGQGSSVTSGGWQPPPTGPPVTPPVTPPITPPVTPPSKPPVTPPSGPPATIHIGHVTSVSGGQPQGKPGGKGDPILTGFDLRPFEFMGQPGSTYNLISEQRHQVSTKLKVGVMFDHNGTYMEGFGFAYRELQVTVEIADKDELAVTLNGKALQLPQSQADLEVIPYVERGEFLLLWQRHREGLGNAVELTTDLLQVVVWITPAGTVDEGGVEQPAYLNFDVSLLGPPSSNEMQGVIGETYSRMLAGQAVQDPEHPLYLPEDFKFHGEEEEYTMDGYFGEHRYNLFGKQRAQRQLHEADEADLAPLAQRFPLRAGGGTLIWAQSPEAQRQAGAALPAAADLPATTEAEEEAQAAMHAGGGRKGRFL